MLHGNLRQGRESEKVFQFVHIFAYGQSTHFGYLETWVQDRVRPDSVQVPGGMLPHCGCPSLSLAWLTHGLLLAGHRAGRGSKGVCPARSSNALLAAGYRASRGGNR